MCIPRRIVLSEQMKQLYLSSIVKKNKSLTEYDRKLLFNYNININKQNNKYEKKRIN